MTTIRDAVPDDAQGIAVVRVETWRSAYAGLIPDEILEGLSVEESKEKFLEAISSQPETRVYVAEEEGRIAGFSLSGPYRDDEPAAGKGEVYALYVLPEAQNRGIGKKLFKKAKDDLFGRNLVPIRVRVLDGSQYSRFYESIGFRLIAERLEKVEGVMLRLKLYEW